MLHHIVRYPLSTLTHRPLYPLAHSWDPAPPPATVHTGPPGNASLPLENNNVRGILSILFAGFFLTVNDTFVKWLVPHYPVGEILFVQACGISLVLFVLLRVRGESLWPVVNWRAHVLRGALFGTGIRAVNSRASCA